MKKRYVFLLLLLFPSFVLAEDCCTNHQGNSGTCSLEGTVVCNDGFVCENISCIITKPIPNIEKKEEQNEEKKTNLRIYGCMDSSAKNYNPKATISDKSCIYYRYGCTDKQAFNYDENAERDDGSCISKIYGCTDQNARNYDSKANINNHKCEYEMIREVDEEIPYKIKIKKDKAMEIGEEEIIQKGITGRMKVKYELIFNGDGKEISKKVLEKNILREAQDRVIKEGSNDPIYNQMIFLYGISILLIIINFINVRNTDDFYFLKEIIRYETGKGSFLFKLLLLLSYFFFVIPVFIDFFIGIKNGIEKRI